MFVASFTDTIASYRLRIRRHILGQKDPVDAIPAATVQLFVSAAVPEKMKLKRMSHSAYV
jgi:hypothetical protein